MPAIHNKKEGIQTCYIPDYDILWAVTKWDGLWDTKKKPPLNWRSVDHPTSSRSRVWLRILQECLLQINGVIIRHPIGIAGIAMLQPCFWNLQASYEYWILNTFKWEHIKVGMVDAVPPNGWSIGTAIIDHHNPKHLETKTGWHHPTIHTFETDQLRETTVNLTNPSRMVVTQLLDISGSQLEGPTDTSITSLGHPGWKTEKVQTTATVAK